jgi:serine/threonine protein kinase
MEKKSSCFGLKFNLSFILINIYLKAYSTVGTPDYIAPEVFKQCGYNNVRYFYLNKRELCF